MNVCPFIVIVDVIYISKRTRFDIAFCETTKIISPIHSNRNSNRWSTLAALKAFKIFMFSPLLFYSKWLYENHWKMAHWFYVVGNFHQIFNSIKCIRNCNFAALSFSCPCSPAFGFCFLVDSIFIEIKPIE